MSDNPVTVDQIREAIRNVPDFPKEGIQFKDITPVLADGRLFAGAVDLLADHHSDSDIDAVVGIDARGFIFAAAVALKLGVGFVPVRKKGKLPFFTHEESYDLEYGSNTDSYRRRLERRARLVGGRPPGNRRHGGGGVEPAGQTRRRRRGSQLSH